MRYIPPRRTPQHPAGRQRQQAQKRSITDMEVRHANATIRQECPALTMQPWRHGWTRTWHLHKAWPAILPTVRIVPYLDGHRVQRCTDPRSDAYQRAGPIPSTGRHRGEDAANAYAPW